MLTILFSIKKFGNFYGTRKFITVFKKSRHISFVWARSIESIIPFHTISWRYFLILSSHKRIGFVNGLLPSGFQIQMLYECLCLSVCLSVCLTCYKSGPSHSSWSNHPKLLEDPSVSHSLNFIVLCYKIWIQCFPTQPEFCKQDEACSVRRVCFAFIQQETQNTKHVSTKTFH